MFQKRAFKSVCGFVTLILLSWAAYAQPMLLDGFESKEGWSFIQSDGVNLKLAVDNGVEGNALRFDYDFTKGTGYGGIQKKFPINLPENFEFSFRIKANSPANNFEIKFLDSSGDNVWWVNNMNYTFPQEWTEIRIKPRHISFAWGPTEDRELKRIDRIEFTIASFVGGKGTIWLDNLTYEPLQPEPAVYPAPKVSASSSAKRSKAEHMVDGLPNTHWQSRKGGLQTLLMDLNMRREYGGLQIDWQQGMHAEQYAIYTSNDAKQWNRAFSVEGNHSHRSFVSLPETQSRYLKIELVRGTSSTYGISELKVLEVEESQTDNNFFRYVAKNSPKGHYPRYFLDEALYWTVTGVNSDVKEALISEDGMVEVEKAHFSIEPMLMLDNQLYSWSSVEPSQRMTFPYAKDTLGFTPTVGWQCRGIEFSTGVSSSGKANVYSHLSIGYHFKNHSPQTKTFSLYLLVRPFQVNPYYQFLNTKGGMGKIFSIQEDLEGKEIAVDGKKVYSTRLYDGFFVSTLDQGSVAEQLPFGHKVYGRNATHPRGWAQGAMRYDITLNPQEETMFFVVAPFYKELDSTFQLTTQDVYADFQKSAEFWKTKVNRIRFNLPKSADRIINTYKSNLVYILINRDNAGIQPGSRSYDRSWIRDGALTSSALLKSGITQEVREFIQWYAPYQYENGKVPCVVDFRGPDPVPEHDSHGQLIYLIREYFNFTQDTSFLKGYNPYVLKAVDYIEELVAERSTDYYKCGNDSIRAHYGLVPESISHEGYSEKPMHSYWDNFFIMKGLKDAVEIQRILGEERQSERVVMIRDTFKENLYNSIELTMRVRGIDYIPGCVELGDFDPTSTTIALTPCNEYGNLPKPQVYNTFNQYYQYFADRCDGNLLWDKYTPYETRLIGTFIHLNEPQRAHELIDYFLNHRRPEEWNHWAEVVWNDERHPDFIGDMPHTWVGSDFINAIRTLFVYEDEYDQSLVLAAALYQDWIDAPEGMSVEHLPTYYGDISYYIIKEEESYIFRIDGDVTLPENGIKIRNFNGSKMPQRVTINGKESTDFGNNMIGVNQLPAEIVIYY